ncbi:cold shock domain-containing protein [Spongiactinospora sp. TRM90649]|uniref:cold shock domain-containing protein n=1 Tax=Spongiactinospora sp. TRM90649 TaxID=3031114 RepID=UPI0023F65BAB|nr:cold shock domain-containing protein [Spongiactinospora sp. TRM90649]MDF5751212.1 cold shock domain-containing protein [Spongiactinospora sp. TRM90649]
MGEVTGGVVLWNEEEGWGVLRSPAVPGDVWAHFSAIEGPPGSYRTLGEGDDVVFTWEAAEQDGFAYRAVAVREAGSPAGGGDTEFQTNDEAYRSTLEITFDDDGDPQGMGNSPT